jgi:serpin B
MKKVFSGMICVLCVLHACSSDGLSGKESTGQSTEKEPLTLREDIALTQGEQAVLQGNNAFAFELLKKVYRNETEGANIFISPLSATLALAMLNNGAAGETQAQIQTALGYGGLAREDVNSYFQKMVKAMQEMDNSVRFESANSLWIANNLAVLQPFKEVNRTYFDAEALNVDFTAPATREVINKWAAEKTHDLIPKFLDSLEPATRMMLINALYFKGDWTQPFDAKNTKNAPFHNANGSTPNVKMMDFAKAVRLSYRKEAEFELVELPYGNEAFSMALLLPAEDASLASIVEGLDAAAWESSLSGMRSQRLELSMPRFKLEYSRSLVDDLKALGMKSMFDEQANFSLISENEALFVSDVLQKTFIEVNEDGAEAAAVTGGIMMATSIEPVIPKLEFNRPFIYFIKERSTGAVFFSGIIRNL